MLAYLYQNPFLIIFIMIFCHIVDDYYLQGILASMKQKAWWQKQESYSSKYKHDYIMALFMHAFSWAFMINLIFILLQVNIIFIIISIIVNCIIHMIIDDLKANRKILNLWFDQAFHIAQIWITFVVFLCVIHGAL